MFSTRSGESPNLRCLKPTRSIPGTFDWATMSRKMLSVLSCRHSRGTVAACLVMPCSDGMRETNPWADSIQCSISHGCSIPGTFDCATMSQKMLSLLSCRHSRSPVATCLVMSHSDWMRQVRLRADYVQCSSSYECCHGQAAAPCAQRREETAFVHECLPVHSVVWAFTVTSDRSRAYRGASWY